MMSPKWLGSDSGVTIPRGSVGTNEGHQTDIWGGSPWLEDEECLGRKEERMLGQNQVRGQYWTSGQRQGAPAQAGAVGWE